MCLIPLITEPFTSVQLILSSSVSSTNPIEQTLSPRTRYNPKGASIVGSESSGVRIKRSMALLSTKLVD